MESKKVNEKKCLVMTMLVCIKQHLSNIWSTIHEKVKQHWGWAEKSVAYKKKRIYVGIFCEKLYFVFLHTFSFGCTWNKEGCSCWYNNVKFSHNMVKSFVVSLDITVIIHVLEKIIKALQEKML